MRIYSFVIALMLLIAAPAYGQVSYGVKAGVNVASLSFDADEDVASSSRIGVLAGGFATIPLGWFSVQPEAIYTIKGAALDSEGFESDYIVDYLEMPVLARFTVRRNVYVAAGPSMAVRLRARTRTSFGDDVVEEIDLDEKVESFDVGLAAALGIEIGRWIVDGRYTHGLADVDADTGDEVKIRNRVLSVSVGIRF